MKTETAKALLIGFAVLVIGYWAIGMFRGDAPGNGSEAPAAPMGFFGVKWYASMDEVKAARPKVVAENDDTLAEDERFYGEDVKVRYVFKGGRLVLFVMTFASPATKEAFDAFQPKLSQDYGGMSSPTRRQRQELLLKFSVSENKDEKDFFDLVKSETIRGFSTSKEVMLGYLDYKVVPGHYYGCVDVTA